jgi:CheY-like chemotaxis protein
VHHKYSDSRLELKITDAGVGISTIDKARIFEEFTQIGNAERDRRKGLGLGLALVKRLLELLEHPLHLSSVVGHGSTFSIKLPVASLDDNSTEEHSQALAFTAKELAGRILVCIDDEPDIRVAMETLADAWKCDVVTAANDTDALVKIQRLQCRVDILIVDFRLRDKHNGVDAAHDLMANLGYTVPVIIITGDTAEAPLKAAHESGFTLLHKPLKPKRLESCINKALITNDQLRSLTT